MVRLLEELIGFAVLFVLFLFLTGPIAIVLAGLLLPLLMPLLIPALIVSVIIGALVSSVSTWLTGGQDE